MENHKRQFVAKNPVRFSLTNISMIKCYKVVIENKLFGLQTIKSCKGNLKFGIFLFLIKNLINYENLRQFKTSESFKFSMDPFKNKKFEVNFNILPMIEKSKNNCEKKNKGLVDNWTNNYLDLFKIKEGKIISLTHDAFSINLYDHEC